MAKEEEHGTKSGRIHGSFQKSRKSNAEGQKNGGSHQKKRWGGQETLRSSNRGGQVLVET